MPYLITTATKKIARLSKRIRAVPGGTSAGKTIGIEEVLIHLAQTDKKPKLTSIVSESVPHLKRGALRDFKNIMQEQFYWDDRAWNATDSIYTFPNGSQIEFFSVDNPDKMRGGRRDRLFMNEANNMAFDAFEQLEVRTKELVFLDWNPSNEFWYYTEVKPKRDDVEELTITYRDNEALDGEIIKSIESRKNRKGWWKVYGEGQLGEVEGKIYSNWQTMTEIPFGARLVRRGLDFGYTNDPTALIDVWYFNGGYIIDEVAYQKGLLNSEIAAIIKNTEQETLIIADSAEPKSIDELRMHGINIMPATKGQGSVNQGIQYVQAQTIGVTQRSLNVMKEYKNYLWKVDKEGRTLNDPEGGLDHALDAIRYAITSLVAPNQSNDAMRQRVLQNRNQSHTMK